MMKQKRNQALGFALALLLLTACVHGEITKDCNCDTGVTHKVVLDIANGVAKPDPLYVKPGDTILIKDVSGKDFYLFMKEEGLTPFADDRYCSKEGVIDLRVTARPEKQTRYPYGLFMPGYKVFDPHFIVDPE